MDELVVYIREAVDRKQENMRRRRRRDALRLQLVKVLEKIAENGTFGVSSCVIERESMSLHPTFVEYMDGARLYLEMEMDKENASIREVKIHFCDFIRIMIKNFSRKCQSAMLKTLSTGVHKSIRMKYNFRIFTLSRELRHAAVERFETASVQFIRLVEWANSKAAGGNHTQQHSKQ